MAAEQELLEALRDVEMRYAARLGGQPATPEEACARIAARVREMAAAPDIAECRFTLPHFFSELLFHALLKRYGLVAYRYQGQRKTTIMVRASRRLVDELLNP